MNKEAPPKVEVISEELDTKFKKLLLDFAKEHELPLPHFRALVGMMFVSVCQMRDLCPLCMMSRFLEINGLPQHLALPEYLQKCIVEENDPSKMN